MYLGSRSNRRLRVNCIEVPTFRKRRAHVALKFIYFQYPMSTRVESRKLVNALISTLNRLERVFQEFLMDIKMSSCLISEQANRITCQRFAYRIAEPCLCNTPAK
jgi:hypothetical protein